MSALDAGVASADDDIGVVGFAKLVGEEFEFFMQAYEMILGRNTKKGMVDLDLSVIGGGKDIFHHHARIFYDFEKRDFFLEVLGKNGCTVQGTIYIPVNNVNIRTDKDTCNQQLQLKEEKDITTYVATLLSNSCAPREWIPVEKLHSELIDHLNKIWSGSKVQKYLTPEDGPSTGTIRNTWYSLLELLKKHPEHFVISTVCRGTATSEFVSLDSLLV